MSFKVIVGISFNVGINNVLGHNINQSLFLLAFNHIFYFWSFTCSSKHFSSL